MTTGKILAIVALVIAGMLAGILFFGWLMTREVFGQQLAHGDAAWIQADPNFKDARGVHCCGPMDCERAPAGAIVERNGAIFIAETGQRFDYKQAGGVHVSRDGDWWWCRRDGEVKCVFRPQGGV